jgi:hypothetical protein
MVVIDQVNNNKGEPYSGKEDECVKISQQERDNLRTLTRESLKSRTENYYFLIFFILLLLITSIVILYT